MFKLILGLNNKDIETSLKIAKTYVEYGIDVIDCSASLFPYLKKELNSSNIKFCVSVALTGDIHNRKAKIIEKNCVKCFNCFKRCSQKAIEMAKDEIYINENKCVGCGHCQKNCKHNAIEMIESNLLDEELDIIDSYKPDFLEIHLSIKKKKEIKKNFKNILKRYKGNVSICLSRKFLSTSSAKDLIEELYKIFNKNNKGNDFIIQADGSSLNNANDSYASNLEAIAFYNELKDLNYKIILSGGLNDKIFELCKLFNLKPYGFAFGSFARKAALENKEIAKKLVDCNKEFYGQN